MACGEDEEDECGYDEVVAFETRELPPETVCAAYFAPPAHYLGPGTSCLPCGADFNRCSIDDDAYAAKLRRSIVDGGLPSCPAPDGKATVTYECVKTIFHPPPEKSSKCDRAVT